VPDAGPFVVATSADVEAVRRAARILASATGFDRIGVEEVALAVSELATNLVRYGRGGLIHLRPLARASGSGVEVESRDEGPGIADLGRAMEDGYSTGGGLGGGLGGVRRMMDEFEIATAPGGTRVVGRKWVPTR
jgi:serine/threonine-protein kinase RsbT